MRLSARFHEHLRFERTCMLAAAGAGAAAALGGSPYLASWAAAGATVALLGRTRRNALVWVPCAVLAAASAQSSWAIAAGCAFALAAAWTWKGDRLPPAGLAAACAAAGLAAWAAGAALPLLSEALAAAVPARVASGIAGAAHGLWIAAACAPLHVRLAADVVDDRLARLRGELPVDLKELAERAAAARREALRSSPAALSGDLRGLLDRLALAALDLARRGAELSRAAAPSLEQELTTRRAGLERASEEAADAVARASFRRASAAVEAQLVHCRTAGAARERLVARLHEEVAQLERARFAVGVLQGGAGAVELDLLSQELQEGTLACELQGLAAPAGRD